MPTIPAVFLILFNQKKMAMKLKNDTLYLGMIWKNCFDFSFLNKKLIKINKLNIINESLDKLNVCDIIIFNKLIAVK